MMDKRSIAFFSLALSASIACNASTISSIGDLKEKIATQQLLIDEKSRIAANSVMTVEKLTKEVNLLESQMNHLEKDSALKTAEFETLRQQLAACKEQLATCKNIEDLLTGSATFK